MLASSLVALMLACTVIALPPKRLGLAKVYSPCKVPNYVALTFDDGPYSYLKDISDILTNAGAKGTFFFNGEISYGGGCIYEPTNIENMNYVYKAGHQIASHTGHANFTTSSYEDIEAQFLKLDQALKRILGIKAAFMRPPYGYYNDLVLQVAAANQQSIVNWDFDALDGDGATAQESKNLYKNQLGNFTLALNHEIESTA